MRRAYAICVSYCIVAPCMRVDRLPLAKTFVAAWPNFRTHVLASGSWTLCVRVCPESTEYLRGWPAEANRIWLSLRLPVVLWLAA